MSAVDLFMKNCKDPWPLPQSCAWCDMIHFCKYADMSAKAIANDPKAFIDQMVVLEALLKRQKAAATAWVKSRGAIEGSKVVFTKKKPTERFTTEFQDINKPKSGATGDSNLDKHFGG